MAYIDSSEMNVGTIALPEVADRNAFVEEASDEIDGKLGWLYATPLPLGQMKDHEVKIIKSICRKLAIGRMVSTYAIPGEGGSLNAFAERMLDEGMQELHTLAAGTVMLSAPRSDFDDPAEEQDETGHGSANARTPSVLNGDSESLVSAFNKTVYGGRPWYVTPDDLMD